jgi:tartrate dehydratase beta subunit/fumarate hydratase class I family protein
MPKGPGQDAVGGARNAMRKSISQNAGLVAKEPLPVSKLSTLAHLGDKEMAGMAKMLQANKSVFPGAAGAAADKAYKSYQVGLGVAWTGMGMDAMDKSLGKSDFTSVTKEWTGEKPYNEGYSDWKDNTLKPAADTHW